MVLEAKYGSPKIVNDGVTIAKEVELEDPVENIGAKLVRQVSMSMGPGAGLLSSCLQARASQAAEWQACRGAKEPGCSPAGHR